MAECLRRGTWDGAAAGRPGRGGVLPGLRVAPGLPGRPRHARRCRPATLVAATARSGPDRRPGTGASACRRPGTRCRVRRGGRAWCRGATLAEALAVAVGRRHRHLGRRLRPVVPAGDRPARPDRRGRAAGRGARSPGRRSDHCGAAWYPSAPPRPLAWLDRDQAPGGVIEEEAMSTPQGGQSGSGQEGSQWPGQQPGSDQPADADATTVYRPGDYGVPDSSGGGSGGPGSPGSSGPSSADPYSGGSSGSAGDSPYSSSSYVPPTSAQPSYGQQPSYGGQPGYDPSSYGQSGGQGYYQQPGYGQQDPGAGQGTTSSPDTVSRSRAGRVISSRATARTTTSNPATASSPAGRTTASPTANPARTASRPTASRQQDTGSRPATAAIRAARPRAASRRRRRRRRSRTRA